MDHKDEDSDSDKQPSWLLEENDAKHREEIMQPLFGTGQLPSSSAAPPVPPPAAAPPPPKQPASNLLFSSASNSVGSSNSSKGNYGSILTGENNKNTEENNEHTADHNDKNNKNNICDGDDDDDYELNRRSFLSNNKPHKPHRPVCLHFFVFIQTVASIALLCLFVTQLLPLMYLIMGSSSTTITLPTTKATFLSFILKGYISFFCLIGALLEMDCITFLRSSSNILQMFLPRGIFYSFIGLVCIVVNSSSSREHVDNDADININQIMITMLWVPLFIEISSWLMIGTGILYMLLGLCCCRRYRDKLLRDEEEDWKQYETTFGEYKRLLQVEQGKD